MNYIFKKIVPNVEVPNINLIFDILNTLLYPPLENLT